MSATAVCSWTSDGPKKVIVLVQAWQHQKHLQPLRAGGEVTMRQYLLILESHDNFFACCSTCMAVYDHKPVLRWVANLIT